MNLKIFIPKNCSSHDVLHYGTNIDIHYPSTCYQTEKTIYHEFIKNFKGFDFCQIIKNFISGRSQRIVH